MLLALLIVNTAAASEAADLESLAVERAADGTEYLAADAEGRYRYFIKLGGQDALQRVRQAVARGATEFTRDQALAEVQAEQAEAIDLISSELQRAVNPSHYFLISMNAIGARLTPSEAEALLALPNVTSIEREQVYQLDTYRGPEFIGAGAIYDGSSVPSGEQLRGRGIIAAIVDSGTNEDHPSFANDPSCGHGSNGVPDKLLSSLDCASTGGGGVCNGPDSSDTGAHGSHVASTVAGNVVLAADDPNLTLPAPFTQISGVAPCASLKTYKACPTNQCPGFNLQASLQNVILDGDASVMNFSISGGTNPWSNGDNDRTKLDIVDAGIFVAASAGNNSQANPTVIGRVNHRGPWVMAVAASTRDGDFTGLMSITAPGTPPAGTQNIVMDPGSDSPLGAAFVDKSILRDTNQTPGSEGCTAGTAFPGGFFNNAVALVQRGGCSFTEKINNAAAAGADMVVIWNNEAGGFGMSTPGQANVPAFSITQAEGQAVADFVDANPTTTEMSFALEPSQGDVLAGFSLRGPTAAPLGNVQKPNITGPGVAIFAADRDPLEYGFKSGTSMSGPHVAGAAALVRQARPDWTPIEVKSALQMTAIQEGFKEDGTTPWDWDDVGHGRVDLTQAALAGFVMDETFDNFLAANPAAAGDPTTLNLPSVRNRSCNPDCTFTRTVSATLVEETNWTVGTVAEGGNFTVVVEPSSFTLGGQPELIFADGWEDLL
ncbi:MAG: S8 family serine peptidase, partial [Pseudomonadota bacterium]